MTSARRGARSAVVAIFPFAVLAVLALAGVALGARPVPLPDAAGALLAWAQGRESADIVQAAVVSRIPRVLTGIVVGAGLAVSGLAIQGATRNPLGDPGILGLNAGASLAVVIGLVLGLTGNLAALLLLAALGTLLAAVVVYAVAAAASRLGGTGGGSPSPISLVLTGAAVTAGAGSVTSAVLLTSPSAREQFRYWTVGTLDRASLLDAMVLGAVVLVGVLIVLAAAPGLDALALGDDMAHGLGTRPERLRAVLLGATVLMTAAATALAGPVGFVGLMIPHALRRLRPGSTRALVLGCAAWGGALLVAADLIGRVALSPAGIPIGVSTVLLGVPVLLVLLSRRSMSL